jgi:hypothetical protein
VVGTPWADQTAGAPLPGPKMGRGVGKPGGGPRVVAGCSLGAPEEPVEGKNTCTGASSVRKSRFWEGGEACVDEKGNVVSSNTT